MRETTPTHLFRWPVRDHGVCRGHRPIAAGGVPCGGRKHQVPVFIEEKAEFSGMQQCFGSGSTMQLWVPSEASKGGLRNEKKGGDQRQTVLELDYVRIT